MTRHLDPDRSPPVELFPFPIDIETGVCNRCSALVPMTDVAKRIHRADHAKVDALEAMAATVALTSQLSGSGSNAGLTEPDSPDPDPTSEAGEHVTRAGGQLAAGSASASRAPASDPTSEGLATRTDEAPGQPGRHRGRPSDPNVPTPEQEATAGRSGVEDANSTQADAAGLPPGSVTGAPAAFPPAAGAINRSRSGGPGDASTGRLPLPELGNPARFAR